MLKPVNHLTESNFTIVLPGPCNANCGFCFWKQSQDEMPLSDYGMELFNKLVHLPESFYMISISGGEPTLSPYLSEALAVIKQLKHRFPKVVLTTNGARLNNIDINLFDGVVDYVNISRHRVNEYENSRIFGIANATNTSQIKSAISKLERIGIPTRLNCVVPSDVIEQWQDFIDVVEMVEYTKNVGASSIAFRVDHRNGMQKHELHQFMDTQFRMVREGGCPVCKSFVYRMNGIEVIWKYSVVEPSLETIERENGIFELIFQPNGKMTADWDGKLEVFANKGELTMQQEERVLTEDELKIALDVIKHLSNGGKVKRGLLSMKNDIIDKISPRVETRTVYEKDYSSSGGCGRSPSYSGGCGGGGGYSRGGC